MKRKSNEFYWEILGISSTKDEKEIKRAYAKKLREIDIEDIESFNDLKDEFDLAREYALNNQRGLESFNDENDEEDYEIVDDDYECEDESLEEEKPIHPYIRGMKLEITRENANSSFSYETKTVFNKADFLGQRAHNYHIHNLNSYEENELESYDQSDFETTDNDVIAEYLQEQLLEKILLNNNRDIMFNYLMEASKFTGNTQVEQLEKLIDFILDHKLFINFYDVEMLLGYINETCLVIDADKLDNLLHLYIYEHLFSYFPDQNKPLDELEVIYMLRKNILECVRYNQPVSRINKYINKLKKVIDKPNEITLYKCLKNNFISDENSFDNIIALRHSLYVYPDDQSLLLMYLFLAFLHGVDLKIENNSLSITERNKEIFIPIDLEKMKENLLPYKYYYLAYVSYRLGYKDKACEYWQKELSMIDFEWDKKILNIIALKDIEINPIIVEAKSNNSKRWLLVASIVLVIIIVLVVYNVHVSGYMGPFKFFIILISIYILRIIYLLHKEQSN